MQQFSDESAADLSTTRIADSADPEELANCRDSKFLVRRCAKPDRKEYTKTIMATGMGFVVMGFIGFFIKVNLVCSAPQNLFLLTPFPLPPHLASLACTLFHSFVMAVF